MLLVIKFTSCTQKLPYYFAACLKVQIRMRNTNRFFVSVGYVQFALLSETWLAVAIGTVLCADFVGWFGLVGVRDHANAGDWRRWVGSDQIVSCF